MTFIFQNSVQGNENIFFFAVFLFLKLCLCPAKLWSNANFASQNHEAMQTFFRKIMDPLFFFPGKLPRLHSLPHGIKEQCRLCPAKSGRHSLRGQQISLNFIFLSIFLIIFVNYRASKSSRCGARLRNFFEILFKIFTF